MSTACAEATGWPSARTHGSSAAATPLTLPATREHDRRAPRLPNGRLAGRARDASLNAATASLQMFRHNGQPVGEQRVGREPWPLATTADAARVPIQKCGGVMPGRSSHDGIHSSRIASIISTCTTSSLSSGCPRTRLTRQEKASRPSSPLLSCQCQPRAVVPPLDAAGIFIHDFRCMADGPSVRHFLCVRLAVPHRGVIIPASHSSARVLLEPKAQLDVLLLSCTHTSCRTHRQAGLDCWTLPRQATRPSRYHDRLDALASHGGP